MITGATEPRSRLAGFLSWTQGLFYIGTGLWPFVDLASFERVTGPKTDDWLVRTVGLLVVVIGTVVWWGARRGSAPPAVVLLAGGSALGLAILDVVHVAAGTISAIYLADAGLEMLLAGLWGVVAARQARRARRARTAAVPEKGMPWNGSNESSTPRTWVASSAGHR